VQGVVSKKSNLKIIKKVHEDLNKWLESYAPIPLRQKFAAKSDGWQTLVIFERLCLSLENVWPVLAPIAGEKYSSEQARALRSIIGDIPYVTLTNFHTAEPVIEEYMTAGSYVRFDATIVGIGTFPFIALVSTI